MKTLLELKDVGRKFVLPDGNDGAAEEKTILDHINLQVTEGEFLAILGPSGSGKSTLLRIMPIRCGWRNPLPPLRKRSLIPEYPSLSLKRLVLPCLRRSRRFG